MKTVLSLICGGMLLVSVARLPAQDAAPPDDPNAPEAIALTVAAATEPRPALKYRLLPAPNERTPGNAAPYYYRAILHMNNIPKEHWKLYEEKSNVWLSSDLNSYPKEEVTKWLPSGAWLSQLETAAYREHCDWDYRIQDLRGMETIGFLLQEIQDCRQLARLIQLKAHHEIMDGRPEDAFRTLRLGYQLARDVAQQPLLINALVGIAIAQMMNNELLVLTEHSEANYYWALASLPRPLIDLRPALQFEMNMPNQLFPFLKDAETAERTPEEWRRLMVEFIQAIPQMASGQSDVPTGWQGELFAVAVVAKLYPIAKDELIAGGMNSAEVEAMPVGQVVAIQTARSVEYAYHEVFKTSLLPYDEATRRMPKVMERLRTEGYLPPETLSGRAGLPIAAILLPAVSNVLHAEVRMGRNRAALEAIEAIRMHAGATGSLPKSLADVSIVPVPANPATGEPFAYALDSATGTATLEIPTMTGQQPRHDAKRYSIRLKSANDQ